MRAVYIKEFGGAENLEIREVENLSKPQNTEVTVRVKAAGLNRADVLQRRGFYPAPKGYPERILGLEFAGEVFETGENVKNFKVGDRVFGITAGAAQAEFVLTEETLLAKIPESLSLIEAAAVPEAFITAHDAVFTQGNLRENETLLIHAVGSGVGLAALQLAKARNIYTLGTSRTLSKLEKCKKFGLDFGILSDSDAVQTSPRQFGELIRFKTSGKGADVILDLIGASYFPANLESIAVKGRLVLVGLTGGKTAEFNLGLALAKRTKIIGTVLRSRSTEEKAEASDAFVKEVLPLFENKKLKPNVDRVFKMEDVKAAHEYVESNESFGKVVLEI